MREFQPTGAAKNQTILYVENRKQWGDEVSKLLSRAGYGVLLFSNVPEARQYHSEHEQKITATLCGDGGFPDINEGINWAAELQLARKKTMTLSSNEARNVPFLSKSNNWCEELLPMLEYIVGGQ